MTDGAPSEDRRAEVRDRFIASRGFWGDVWDQMLGLDPEFVDRYRALSELPWQRDAPEASVKELICVAVDATATHLYDVGTDQHIGQALQAGATPLQVMQVLELVSTVGLAGSAMGASALLRFDDGTMADGASEHQVWAMRELGFWDPSWDALGAVAPELLAAHLGLIHAAMTFGALDRKTCHLVLLAAHATVTTLHTGGAITHLRAALDAGASRDEIVTVLSIVGMVGIHASTSAVPLLMRHVAATAGERG